MSGSTFLYLITSRSITAAPHFEAPATEHQSCPPFSSPRRHLPSPTHPPPPSGFSKRRDATEQCNREEEEEEGKKEKKRQGSENEDRHSGYTVAARWLRKVGRRCVAGGGLRGGRRTREKRRNICHISFIGTLRGTR